MPGLEIPGEFLRHAVLDTVVPYAPAVDIEGSLTAALEDGADELSSVLASIPQRPLLFFGMWSSMKKYLHGFHVNITSTA